MLGVPLIYTPRYYIALIIASRKGLLNVGSPHMLYEGELQVGSSREGEPIEGLYKAYKG